MTEDIFEDITPEAVAEYENEKALAKQEEIEERRARRYSFREDDWYQSLCDDISASYSERRFQAEMLVLEWYEETGKRLMKEIGERAAYGERIIPTLAEDTGISSSTLYNALSIARAMGDMTLEEFIETLGIEGKTPSLRKVVAAITEKHPVKNLPDHGRCPACHRKMRSPITPKVAAEAIAILQDVVGKKTS